MEVTEQQLEMLVEITRNENSAPWGTVKAPPSVTGVLAKWREALPAPDKWTAEKRLKVVAVLLQFALGFVGESERALRLMAAQVAVQSPEALESKREKIAEAWKYATDEPFPIERTELCT